MAAKTRTALAQRVRAAGFPGFGLVQAKPDLHRPHRLARHFDAVALRQFLGRQRRAAIIVGTLLKRRDPIEKPVRRPVVRGPPALARHWPRITPLAIGADKTLDRPLAQTQPPD